MSASLQVPLESPVSNKNVEPDDAKHPSDVIGNWGPIQKRILILVTLAYVVGPMNNAGIVFYQPTYDFYCNFYNETSKSWDKMENTCEYPDSGGVMQTCTNFTYDETIFKRTIVSEFDLVCSRSYYGSVSQVFHQIGYLVSGVGLGYLSDKKGRKTAAVIATALEIVAGFGQVLAPSIYFFWFSRFFLGIATYGRFMACYVLLSEWIGPESRAQAIALYEYGWMSGALGLPFLFQAVSDYKIIQSGVCTYGLLFLISFLLLVWESPRWLLTHGKFEEASEKLTIAAKAKGKLQEDEIKRRISMIEKHTKEEVIAGGAGNQTVFDSWRVPEIGRLSMILYFTWFTMSFIFYAFTLNMQSLGGDLFTNFFIFSAVDFVIHTILYFFINQFSRKTLLDVSLSVQTIALLCLLITSFDDAHLVYRIIASCFLRAGMSVAYVINYLYTAESFPTCMRQSAMGTCSIFSRVGSISAPFIKELTNATHLSVPTGLFMTFTITNLILIQLIPETGKIQMPDTIRQKKATH